MSNWRWLASKLMRLRESINAWQKILKTFLQRRIRLDIIPF